LYAVCGAATRENTVFPYGKLGGFYQTHQHFKLSRSDTSTAPQELLHAAKLRITRRKPRITRPQADFTLIRRPRLSAGR